MIELSTMGYEVSVESLGGEKVVRMTKMDWKGMKNSIIITKKDTNRISQILGEEKQENDNGVKVE